MASSQPRSAGSAIIGGAVALGLLGAIVSCQQQGQPAQGGVTAQAMLTTAKGEQLGMVTFVGEQTRTRVSAKLTLPAGVNPNTFHGFHIHANDKPENGNGCLADPAKPANTWFVSADGHLADAGTAHSAHTGDMPSILVNTDGTAEITFTTPRLNVADLTNRAVILHMGPDNFGNIPVGTAADQYTPNSQDAVTKTNGTGNAGDRLACGLITITGGAPT